MRASGVADRLGVIADPPRDEASTELAPPSGSSASSSRAPPQKRLDVGAAHPTAVMTALCCRSPTTCVNGLNASASRTVARWIVPRMSQSRTTSRSSSSRPSLGRSLEPRPEPDVAAA